MLTHESGASRDIQSVFYQSGPPRSYLGWGQSSQLGFSLGLAMGAKLANPDKLVVNVMGDASVGMTGMDWETASRNDIPILTVIKHDSIFSGYDRNIPEPRRRSSEPAAGRLRDHRAASAAHAEREPSGGAQTALGRAIGTNEGQPAVGDAITAETRSSPASRRPPWAAPPFISRRPRPNFRRETFRLVRPTRGATRTMVRVSGADPVLRQHYVIRSEGAAR